MKNFDNMKLSEHFKLGEMTVTNVKTADGNIPSKLERSSRLRFLQT